MLLFFKKLKNKQKNFKKVLTKPRLFGILIERL